MQEKKSTCNYITDYYPLIYQAEFEYELKRYDQAFKFYESAFDLCTPINTYTINEIGKYVEICVILQHDERALELIELSLSYGDELSWFTQNSAYTELFATKEGKNLISRYALIRNKYLSGINLQLRRQIKEMNRVDQLYRNGQFQDFEQDSVDSENTKKLIEIFTKFGYPSEQVIGNYSLDQLNVDIVTLLLHTSDSVRMNYFVPRMTDYVRSGVCSPKTLGQVIDQYYLYNNQPQIYGTYMTTTTRYANMIIDRNQVNRNRISIGLPPLELEEKIDSIRRVNYPHRYRFED